MVRRAAVAIALFACVWSGSARADDAPPSPERIKAAAEEFDRGRRAYLAKDYEQAAVHFENAFRDAPRAETLRLAIRARREAKQLARAATLAAVAEQRYADDAPTTQLAKETLEAARPELHEYVVECTAECAIAADGRVVSQRDGVHHRIFLEPGPHDLGVSFREERGVARKVDAVKGGKDTLAFDPPPRPAPGEGPPPTNEKPAPPTPAPQPPSDKPLGPLVFFVASGVTIGAGALTVWSGLDTQSSPGVDAVRRECAGKDASCPLYDEGQDKEVRANVLLAATAGAALVTVVIGVFFTKWSSSTGASGVGLRQGSVGPRGAAFAF